MKHWKKSEEGYWEHESGEYFMSLYDAGGWYGELQDKQGNSLGLVAYTKYKADGMKRCTKARRVLDTVERIKEFVDKHSTFPNAGWNEIEDLMMSDEKRRDGD